MPTKKNELETKQARIEWTWTPSWDAISQTTAKDENFDKVQKGFGKSVTKPLESGKNVRF